jgi:hypothetical protein
MMAHPTLIATTMTNSKVDQSRMSTRQPWKKAYKLKIILNISLVIGVPVGVFQVDDF